MALKQLRRLRLPASTVEKIQVPVTADRGATDVTQFLAETALIDDDATPSGGDWSAAAWSTAPGVPVVEKLVTGALGTRAFWVRITGGGETVVRKVAIIEFV